MNYKLSGMLGLAVRAGKAAVGEQKAMEAARSGRAKLLMLATDTAVHTEKRFQNISDFRKIPLISPGDRFAMGSAAGREIAVVLAITDIHFAEQIKLLAQTQEG